VRLDTPTPSNVDDGFADLSILSLSSVKDQSEFNDTPSPTKDNSSLNLNRLSRSQCLPSTEDETHSKITDSPDTQDTSSSKNGLHVEMAGIPVAAQIDDMK
jgi:hypothetical protein